MYPNRKLQEMSLQLFLQNRVAPDIFWAVALWLLLCLGALAVSWVNADNVRAENAAFEFVSALAYGANGDIVTPEQQFGASLHHAFPTPNGQRAILELIMNTGAETFWMRKVSLHPEKVEEIFAGEYYVSRSITTWGDFFWSVLTIGVPFLWPLFSFVSIVNLAEALGKEKQRFYDLPWHRRWMRWYAIATFPLSTPFFIGSERKWRPIEVENEARRKELEVQREQERLARVERIREQQEEELRATETAEAETRRVQTEREEARLAAAAVADRIVEEQRALRARTERNLQEARLERIFERRRQLAHEVTALASAQTPEQTLAHWRRHRREVSYEAALRRVLALKQNIPQLQERLVLLGQRAQKQQRRLTGAEQRQREVNGSPHAAARHAAEVSVRGIRRRLVKIGRKIERTQRHLAEAMQADRFIANGPVPFTEKAERINDEWQRLLALPQILGGRVTAVCIEVWTKPVVVMVRGGQIDLGSYCIVVHDRLPRPAIKCCVSTRNDNRGHLYGGEDFCYGSRNEEMRMLMRRREYLSAIVLAVEALHHVNEVDQPNVLHQYLEVTNGLVSTSP